MKDKLEELVEKAQKPRTAEEVLGREFGVQTEKEAWYGQEMQAQSGPLIDPGVGQEVIVRPYVFAKNPAWQGRRPSDQDLFNMHWQQIKTMLWADGLVENRDVNPRIVHKQDGYTIFVTCQPGMNKQGVKNVVIDKAKRITDYLK